MKPTPILLLQLPITPAQGVGLGAIASRHGLDESQLLRRFIADLTDTAGCGGSDEYELAQAWAQRSLRGITKPLTPKQQLESERLTENAYQLARQERQETGGAR